MQVARGAATNNDTASAANQVLLSCEELASTLLDGAVIVDCRFDLAAAHAGFHCYLAGHIPGARYAHLDKDLARRPRPWEGRHPLPEPEAFAAWLGRSGIARSTPVVVYDDSSGAIASRLWWMLRWVGHDQCRILDGGLSAWREHGEALEAGLPAWDACRYDGARAQAHWEVRSDEVDGGLADGDILVDARAPARFRGEIEPIDPVAGHVPGAINVPFDLLLAADGRFQAPESLAALFADRLGGADASKVVAMCGSGVTACHVLAGLRLAGLGDGRLYAGSWSEWIRDEKRLIARGP